MTMMMSAAAQATGADTERAWRGEPPSSASTHPRLRLRGTFIDVDEEDTQQASNLPNGRRRSLSWSDFGIERDAAGGFCEDHAYVASLSDKLSSLWGPRAPSGAVGQKAEGAEPSLVEEPRLRTEALRRFFHDRIGTGTGSLKEGDIMPESREAAVEQGNRAVSDALLRTKLAMQPTELGSNATPASAAGDSETRAPTASDVVSDSGNSALTPSPQPLSPEGHPGSIGHPYLCSRPCLYFAAGACANGSSCEFCHLPHTKRPAHLDKKHRQMLQDLPVPTMNAIMLPILREKVLAFDNSPETLALFGHLVAACGNVPALEPCKSRRLLCVALKAMSLRLLLITLQRSALQGHPEANAASEALLTHLRRRASKA